jgi:NADPH:quinone reductase-like Zn-dependent oxidoreductase
MVLQMARRQDVTVISIVRHAQRHLNLKPFGPSAVIELSKLSETVGERIADITQNAGIHGVIHSVGGVLAGELVRSLSLGGQVIIYGGFSPDKFELHNFDILMKAAEIRAYVYRYFFTPPRAEDTKMLQEIAEVSGGSDFKVPLAGMHALEDFQTAIQETVHHPERGKHFFRME